MKALSTVAFGAVALLFASFATAEPAAAHGTRFGVTIQVGHDDYSTYGHRRCWNRWYRRHHPYECYRGWRDRDDYGWYPRYRRDRYYDDYWNWHNRYWPYCRDRRPYHRH